MDNKINNETDHVDLNKVKDWYFRDMGWYKALKLFTQHKWVNREHLAHITRRSVSSATAPLKDMGFKFERRKTFKEVDGQKVKVTQYSLTHTPLNFKKD